MTTALVDLTPNSLLELPAPEDGKFYELSEGELIVVGYANAGHELVKSNILKLLFAWDIQYSAGRVFAESMFTLSNHTARIPDAAVVLKERVSLLLNPDITIPIAPDLAVEVISQSESATYAEKKVREYLAAGVVEIWQVYPDEKIVRVHWNKDVQTLQSGNTLRSRVMKDFEVAVDQFFVR